MDHGFLYLLCTYRILALLFFNGSTIHSHYVPQTGPQHLAGLGDKVLSHAGPLQLHGGLKVHHTPVRIGTDPGLQSAPDSIIQWIGIWALGWPEGGVPHVLQAPLLDHLGLVVTNRVLLPAHNFPRQFLVHPWLDQGLQDFLIVVLPTSSSLARFLLILVGLALTLASRASLMGCVLFLLCPTDPTFLSMPPLVVMW